MRLALGRQRVVGREQVVKVLSAQASEGSASALVASSSTERKARVETHLEHALQLGLLLCLDPAALDVEDVGRLVERHAVVARDGVDVAAATADCATCCCAFCAGAGICAHEREG